MAIFKKAPDGGPQSPVKAYFLCEFKGLFSIALLNFAQGGREAFHTHAFNAITWFLCGDLEEEQIDGTRKKYRRSLIPKLTKRDNNHRVRAAKSSWCFTIRGPWKAEWTEDDVEAGVTTIFGHGCVIRDVKSR
jgi:hypothetical protein